MLKVIIPITVVNNYVSIRDESKTRIFCPKCGTCLEAYFYVPLKCKECNTHWPDVLRLIIEYDRISPHNNIRPATIKYHKQLGEKV